MAYGGRLLPAIALAAAASALQGCGWLADLMAPAGTVSGRIFYAGEPAAGRKVYLASVPAGTRLLETASGPDGRYVFTGVKGSGQARVEYQMMRDAAPALVKPNEVAAWRAKPRR